MTRALFIILFFLFSVECFSHELKIILSDEDGNRIPGVSVTIGKWQYRKLIAPKHKVSNNNGVCFFSEIPAGVFSIETEAENFEKISIPLVINSDIEKNIVLSKTPIISSTPIIFFTHCTLRGRVFDKKSGHSISGASLSFLKSMTYSDNNGRFCFRDIETPDISVIVNYPGYTVLTEEVKLKEGKNFHDFYLQKIEKKYTISGVVKNKNTGESVKSNIIIDGTNYITDESGKYSVELKGPSKKHSLKVSSDGFDVYKQDFTLSKSKIKMDILLNPKHSQTIITGIIRSNKTGSPISGAKVLLGGKITFTDNKGKYSFSGISPGQYSLKVIYNEKSVYSQDIIIYKGTQKGDLLVDLE